MTITSEQLCMTASAARWVALWLFMFWLLTALAVTAFHEKTKKCEGKLDSLLMGVLWPILFAMVGLVVAFRALIRAIKSIGKRDKHDT